MLLKYEIVRISYVSNHYYYYYVCIQFVILKDSCGIGCVNAQWPKCAVMKEVNIGPATTDMMGKITVMSNRATAVTSHERSE